MAAAVILKNLKIAISQPQLGRFWRNLVRWRNSTLLTDPTVKNLKFPKSKMAAAAILKNRKIAISRPRFNRFDQIWHDDAVRPSWPPRPLKIWNFQNPRWRRPPSWKIEKSPYLGRVSTDFDQIWHGVTFRTSWPSRPLKIRNIKNPRWRRPPSWKPKNSISQPQLGRFWRNLARSCSSTLLTAPTVKNLKFINARWRRPPSWKIENWHISSVVWAISTKFGTVTQFVLLDRSDR